MDITNILSVLSQNGFAKRPIQTVTKRVVDAIKQTETPVVYGSVDYQKLRKLERLYFGLWQDDNGRVPPEVLEHLISYHGKCVGCERPAFDGYTGREYEPYCSEGCANDNDDVVNEYERECANCGETYDSDNEGGYLDYTDSDACSSSCAWNLLHDPVVRWLRRNGYDTEATIEAFERDVSPWDLYNDRELQRIAVEYGTEAE